MKIGDKLICIKEYPSLYLKNKIYYIIEISGELKPTPPSLNRTGEYVIFIKSEINHNYGFHVDDESYEISFNKYFINIQEQRKLKLQKINERR